MLRCTIELIPCGDENQRKTIGLIEIANDGSGSFSHGNYIVVIRKSAPWKGALKDVWKAGKFTDNVEAEFMTAHVGGHDRVHRGVYDLLYKALRACVGFRNED